MKYDFSDRVVMVTGATGGIGLQTCRTFADLGARVIAISTSLEKLKIFEGHSLIEGVCYDLSKCDAVENMVAKLIEKHKKIDVLVNNAGTTKDALSMRMSREDWRLVMGLNLDAVFYLSKEVLRFMLKERYGKIINMSSVVGFSGNPGQANYVASKAGLVGLTKSLALEYASKGININAIAPGFIVTPMTEKLTLEQRDRIVLSIASKKMGEPEDVVNGILFLASDFSKYVHGTTLHINGGLYL